jgi:hypothetical protein
MKVMVNLLRQGRFADEIMQMAPLGGDGKGKVDGLGS